jgi:catechol 2,3-dioxygenase-like lactoylglutathione lyase family enzyme
MISHVFIGVNDFECAYACYAAVMAELGYVLRFRRDERPWAAWMGVEPRPIFVIGAPENGEPATPGNGQMAALLAPSRAAVDAAYRAALAHGAVCAGPPGLRPQYHPDYYGAYFRDPEGNKICVAHHQPES